MTAMFTDDNDILWLCVAKSGTPDRWRPGTNYKKGDTVVPRFPVSGQEDIMFQCVGFIGKSNNSEPTWVNTNGALVIDNNIEWIARDPDVDPASLPTKEYYLIDQTVSVS